MPAPHLILHDLHRRAPNTGQPPWTTMHRSAFFHGTSVALAAMIIGAGLSGTSGWAAADQGQSDMSACVHDADRAKRVAACSLIVGSTVDARHRIRALNARGIALCDLNRCREAVEDFTEVTRLSPSVAGYFDNLSRALRAAERFKEAIAASDQAIRLAPTFPFTYIGKARVLDDSHRYDEALQLLDRATELAPTDAGIWQYRGTLLGELKQYPDAYEAFAKAFSLDPKRSGIYLARAKVETAEGRLDAAIGDLETYPADGSKADEVSGTLRMLRATREFYGTETPSRTNKSAHPDRESLQALARQTGQPSAEDSKPTNGHPPRSPEELRYLKEVYARIVATHRTIRGRIGEWSLSISLAVDRCGRLASISMKKSSGDQEVDAAALQAVMDAAPFPPPPSGSLTRLIARLTSSGNRNVATNKDPTSVSEGPSISTSAPMPIATRTSDLAASKRTDGTSANPEGAVDCANMPSSCESTTSPPTPLASSESAEEEPDFPPEDIYKILKTRLLPNFIGEMAGLRVQNVGYGKIMIKFIKINDRDDCKIPAGINGAKRFPATLKVGDIDTFWPTCAIVRAEIITNRGSGTFVFDP